MRELRQSTEQIELIGPYLDKTDGVTEETGLTTPATEISKDGGSYGTGPAGGTHDSEGWYPVTFTTTHTNTLGSLMLKSQDAATHLAVFEPFMVVTANYYDSKYGTDVRDASVTQWLGTAVATPTVGGVPEVDLTHMEGGTQTVTDLKDFADAGYDPATNKVTGVLLVDTTTTNTDVRGTDSAALASVCTEGRLAELDAGNLPTDVAAVKTETALILTDTGTTLDTKINDIQGATFSSATDSLEAIRDRGDAAWTTGAGGSNPFVLQNTTIATLSTQVSFTLTAGSADDDAYNGMLAIVEDVSTATQRAVGVISDYTGSSKTVTLREDPGIFVMAATDTIDIVVVSPDVLDILADTADMQPKLGTPATDVSADIAAVKAETALIVTDTGTTLDTKINDIQGATFSSATDSLEAIRDRGDAEWTTGGGTGLSALSTGAAQAGGATTITLASGDSATTDIYNGTRVLTTGGTGANQSRVITAYNGSTKVATVARAWTTNPDGTTTYEVQAADSNLETIQTDEVSVTDIKDFADAGYDPGTNKVQGVVLVDTTTTNTDVRGTDSAALASVCTESRLAELDAGNLPTDIAAVKSDTAAILTDTGTTIPATLGTPIDTDLATDIASVQTDTTAILVDTGTTLSADIAALPTAAEINTEVDTALVDVGLDHLISASVAGADVADDSIIAQLVSKEATADWDDFSNTSDSLQAQADVCTEARLAELDGANLPTDVAAVKSDTAAILTDTADIQPKIGTPATDLAADIAAVKTEADKIALADAGAGVTGSVIEEVENRSTLTTAQVNTEVDTALTDIGLDHLVFASVAGADITDDSIIAQLVSKEATADWDDFVNTSDSLQAQADVSTEVRLAELDAGNLITDVANVKTDTAAILTDTGTTLSADIAALPTGDENADALLDRANAIETGLTLRQAQRLIAAASAGKLSGAATTTVVIREAVNDSKARITATVDSDGNRSAITWDVT